MALSEEQRAYFREYKRREREMFPEKVREKERRIAAKRRAEGKVPSVETQRRYSREYRHRKTSEDPFYFFFQKIRWTYKLTREEYLDLLEAQGAECANPACDRPVGPEFGRESCIDHDHACCTGGRTTCGECVRGILCRACNSALGQLKDSEDRILGLAAYLARGSKCRSTDC